MNGFLVRALISALGLWIASRLVPGIVFDSPMSLILAALLLGVVNAIVRPIAILLTLPLTLLTLGLFLLVINAAMVGLVAALLPGFHVHGFGSALLTAIILWLTGWVASAFIGSHGGIDPYGIRRAGRTAGTER
jgi:putative membrane protein